jgi:hypothetical protein
MNESQPEFPRGLTDKQLCEVVGEYSAVIARDGADTNAVLRLAPLMALGQQELHARSQRKAIRLLAALVVIALLLSVAALALAGYSQWASSRRERTTIQKLESLKSSGHVHAGKEQALLAESNKRLAEILAALQRLGKEPTPDNQPSK